MKLESVKVYQAVEFKKKSVVFFHVKNSIDPHREVAPLELNYNKQQQLVEIKQGEDHILVPVTNVAIMTPYKEPKPEPIKNTLEAEEVKEDIKAD